MRAVNHELMSCAALHRWRRRADQYVDVSHTRTISRVPSVQCVLSGTTPRAFCIYRGGVKIPISVWTVDKRRLQTVTFWSKLSWG